MTDHPKDFPSLRGPAILGSPTSFKKLGGKVTNEDLQATMVQVEKYGKYLFGDQMRYEQTLFLNRKFAKKTRSGVFYPKRQLYSRNDGEAILENEPTILLFSLLEEEKEKGKEKMGPGVD
ncbi:hypothetical protein ACFX15_046123 [Malus domestica]